MGQIHVFVAILAGVCSKESGQIWLGNDQQILLTDGRSNFNAEDRRTRLTRRLDCEQLTEDSSVFLRH